MLKPHWTLARCRYQLIDHSTKSCIARLLSDRGPAGEQLHSSPGRLPSMHFALPPRKTSHPPPYARAAAARNSSDRRRKLYQLGSYVVLGFLTIYLIFHYAFSSRNIKEEQIESIPAGTPPVVIVTVLDEEHMSADYMHKIRANREDYASRHGEPLLFPSNPTSTGND
jgi:hypothetical protein